ncbi:unnamed protein product [Ostreobium quekettii]|uniref:Uncharacterized protein n=1 Tax=Ostreobium quekettii TaxID=121088 RepID=A0A8S1J6W3_9CHLO|nr:unnamed protein product [Ostreobium quekettii]
MQLIAVRCMVVPDIVCVTRYALARYFLAQAVCCCVDNDLETGGWRGLEGVGSAPAQAAPVSLMKHGVQSIRTGEWRGSDITTGRMRRRAFCAAPLRESVLSAC